MKTTTTTPETTTPERTLRILQPIDQTGRGTIRISERVSKSKVEVKVYELVTFPAYDGSAIGISFTQADGTLYNVCINGKHSTCECKGFLRWHKPCRHILAGLKLKELGKLHLPMTQDNDDETESYDLAEAALCWDVADCY